MRLKNISLSCQKETDKAEREGRVIEVKET
jgi:hypothetical protein